MPRSPQPTSDPTGALDAAAGPPDLDLAVVVGTLSSDPVVQELPSGSRLIRYEVTVRDRSPADTVPVSWFDPPRPPKLTQGDRIVVVGRVRRRFFRAGGATRSATEIVAGSVCRPRSTGAAAAAVAEAAEVLAAQGAGDRR
jgi:single-strand DNA-binding protein